MRCKPSEDKQKELALKGVKRMDYTVTPRPNMLVPQTKEGKRKCKAVCKKCGDLLATFWSADKTLKNPIDLVGHYYVTKDGWFGCRGININPQTSEVNFECSCMNAIIEGKVERVNGVKHDPPIKMKRYTEYKLLYDTGGRKR